MVLFAPQKRLLASTSFSFQWSPIPYGLQLTTLTLANNMLSTYADKLKHRAVKGKPYHFIAYYIYI